MKKTIKDYLTVLFGTGFSRGIAFINAIIVARLLGPVAFGKFSVFFTVLVLARVFPEAFDATYVRYAKELEHEHAKSEVLKVSILFKGIYAIVVGLVSYPIAHFISHTCFQKPELTNLIILGLIGGAIQSFLMTLASVYQEREHFGVYSFLYASYTVVILMCLLISDFFIHNFTLENVIWIYFWCSVLVGIVSLSMLLVNNIHGLFSYNRQYLYQSFHLGKWIFGIVILSFLFQKLDFLFLSRFTDYKLMGVYSVALQIVMIISVLTGALAGVFLPKACRSLESVSGYRIFTKDAFMISSVINVFVIILMIFAPKLIVFVYGDEYSKAGLFTQIILVGWFFAIYFMPYTHLFYVLDDSKTKFVLECCKIGLIIMLLYMAIPVWGALGAAVSMSVVLIIEMVVSMLILRKKVQAKLLI